MSSVNNSSNSNSNRGWFEGTLDVISVATGASSRGGGGSRPTTPVPQRPTTPIFQQRTKSNSNGGNGGVGGWIGSITQSAPSSPVAHNNGGISLIHRLPSQDSLDQSIHNDSGHGGSGKTTAQMVRDLRQSNARLTSRMAAMEADYMNQLNVMTKQSTEQSCEIQKSTRDVQTLQTRLQNAELRVRESNDTMSKIKEESAFQRHTISNLRTQLHQYEEEQENNGTTRGAAAKAAVVVEAEAHELSKAEADKLKEERDMYEEKAKRLQRQVDHYMNRNVKNTKKKKERKPAVVEADGDLGDDEDETTTSNTSLADGEDDLIEDELFKWNSRQQQQQGSTSTTTVTESKLVAELRDENVRLQHQHEIEIEKLRDELQLSKAGSNNTKQQEEGVVDVVVDDGNNNNNNDDKKDTNSIIQQLRDQVLDYSTQLTALTSEITKVKSDAAIQDSYRREEVDDLRVLNDAQDDEIELLRKQLEDAIKELELREQEVQEMQKKCDDSVQEMETKMKSIETHYQEQLNELENESNAIQSERDELLLLEKKKNASSLSSTTNRGNVNLDGSSGGEVDEANMATTTTTTNEAEAEVEREVLQQQIKSLESRCDVAERELIRVQDELITCNQSKRTLEQDYELKLRDFEETMELMENSMEEAKIAAAAVAVRDESALKMAATTAEADRAAAVAEVEELKGQLESVRNDATKTKDEMDIDIQQKQHDNLELVSKLEDRDTTISALVKSSVTLEQQLASYKLEMDALRQKLMTTSSSSRGGIDGGGGGDNNNGDGGGYNNDTAGNNIGMVVSEAGCDVILADESHKEEMAELRDAIDVLQGKERSLVEENTHLQNHLQNIQHESSRLRTQLETMKSENLVLKSQLEQANANSNTDNFETNSNTGSSVVSIISQTMHQQIQERDNAIANLVTQSIEQDKLVTELQSKLSFASNEINSLKQQRVLQQISGGGGSSSNGNGNGDEDDNGSSNDNSSSSNSNNGNNIIATTPSWLEIQELRKETEMFAAQVIEQDEELECVKNALKQREDQLMILEKEIADYRELVSSITADNTNANASTTNTTTDREVVVKNNKDHDSMMIQIQQLQAEIDEMSEANEVLLDELRLLRRKSSDSEQAAQEIDRLKREIQVMKEQGDKEYEQKLDAAMEEKTKALNDIEQGKRSKEEEVQQLQIKLADMERDTSERVCVLESKLAESERTIQNVRAELVEAQTQLSNDSDNNNTNNSSTVDEMEVEGLRSEVEDLKRDLNHQSTAVTQARETIRELERVLAVKNSNEAAAWDEEKDELISDLETLTQQLDEAREEIKLVEEQRTIIEDFKLKLEEADEAREESEKNIIESYERKVSFLTLDKDVTIDKLRKELAQTKATSDEEIEMMSTRLHECQIEMTRIREELTSELQDRDGQVLALQRTLEAQEQLANNMKTEMDQLQGSMETNVTVRRQEVDEMQKELVELTSNVQRQEREIKSLQGQLQDRKVEYEAEISKLKETIDLMENDDDADHRTAQDLKMEIAVREVKDRLEKLKWRNSTLSEENQTLRDRLIKAEEGSNAADNDADRQRITELQSDLDKQRDIIQDLKSELNQLKKKSPPAAAAPAAPATKRSSSTSRRSSSTSRVTTSRRSSSTSRVRAAASPPARTTAAAAAAPLPPMPPQASAANSNKKLPPIMSSPRRGLGGFLGRRNRSESSPSPARRRGPFVNNSNSNNNNSQPAE